MVPGKQIVRAAYLNDKLEFKIFGALQVITKKGPFVDHYTFLGNCATYPSSKQTLTLTSHLGQNVGLGEE